MRLKNQASSAIYNIIVSYEYKKHALYACFIIALFKRFFGNG